MSDAQTLDLTNVSVPDVEVVEDVPDNEVPVVSEVVVEEEEPVSSEAEVSEEVTEEPVVSEEAEEPVVTTEEPEVEEPVTITLEPVVSSPEPAAPVEQVVSDIREILTDVPAPAVRTETLEESSDSSELTEDLKQRIAELDYLRECCEKWVEGAKSGRKIFLNLWENRSISVNLRVNYEDALVQLEKLPELILMWDERIPYFRKNNYFKNINNYKLKKSLFNENQNTIQKIEVLEQLIILITDCANMKYKEKNIELKNFINNLY